MCTDPCGILLPVPKSIRQRRDRTNVDSELRLCGFLDPTNRPDADVRLQCEDAGRSKLRFRTQRFAHLVEPSRWSMMMMESDLYFKHASVSLTVPRAGKMLAGISSTEGSYILRCQSRVTYLVSTFSRCQHRYRLRDEHHHTRRWTTWISTWMPPHLFLPLVLNALLSPLLSFPMRNIPNSTCRSNN
jgi:hypothetical protein